MDIVDFIKYYRVAELLYLASLYILLYYGLDRYLLYAEHMYGLVKNSCSICSKSSSPQHLSNSFPQRANDYSNSFLPLIWSNSSPKNTGDLVTNVL